MRITFVKDYLGSYDFSLVEALIKLLSHVSVTWTRFQPSGSCRYHWSTFDWAGLRRWACRRRGPTGAAARSPCETKVGWVMLRVAWVMLSWWPTWSFCTLWWRRALCSAATSRQAANYRTCGRPQSSAPCRAPRWSRSEGGNVWAAHPQSSAWNIPTSRSERLCPWAGRPDLDPSWESGWALLPSLWRWLWCDKPGRWRTRRGSCWLLTFWPLRWKSGRCTFCSHKGWPGGALGPRAFCRNQRGCNCRNQISQQCSRVNDSLWNKNRLYFLQMKSFSFAIHD